MRVRKEKVVVPIFFCDDKRFRLTVVQRNGMRFFRPRGGGGTGRASAPFPTFLKILKSY